MKLMLAGDWHGNIQAGIQVIKRSVENQCAAIVQLGDFGIWPGYDGVKYLDDLNVELRMANRNLLFVGGNHEDYNQIEAWEKVNARSTNGHVYVRSNILYIPRGSTWKWNNKKFLALGGAVSIDKAWREPGKSWWWQEAITNEQMQEAVTNAKYRGEIDYFFTHDCSDKTPWRNRLKPDPDSKTNRKKIDWVLDRVKPKMHFHGHMHEWYDWEIDHALPFSDDAGPYTKVFGLGMENERNASGILDTSVDTFYPVPWKMPRPVVL